MALLMRSWMRQLAGRGSGAGSGAVFPSPLLHRLSAARSYRPPVYEEKVGLPEFLKGVGNGAEAHVAKLEAEIGDLQTLLVTRTLRLKKLDIPCKQRKLILRYTHKYRLGLWRPLAEPKKKSA